MSHWTEVARRRHQAAERQLAQAVNASSISVPVGDTDATAPGWLYLGDFFSCIPDVQYPFDPAVVRAIREKQPDAVPVVVRSVYQWSNYYELGKFGEPIVLVRHGFARAIRDAIAPVHPSLRCSMPAIPVDGLRISGRTLMDTHPNYVENIWYDRDRKPWGPDLPGTYLPFDWSYYYALVDGYDELARMRAQSRRDVDAEGQVIAENAATESIEGKRADEKQRKRSRSIEHGYMMRDLESYHSVQPSDSEWKSAYMGAGSPKTSAPVSVSVSGPAESSAPAPTPSTELVSK